MALNDKIRLQLVDKLTSPGEMFLTSRAFLSSSLATVSRQIGNTNKLVACSVFADGTKQDQIQSLYFSQTQVSIHLTITHRHSLKDIDGLDSLVDEPNIATEHFFLISLDLKHDHHSVHEPDPHSPVPQRN